MVRTLPLLVHGGRAIDIASDLSVAAYNRDKWWAQNACFGVNGPELALEHVVLTNNELIDAFLIDIFCRELKRFDAARPRIYPVIVCASTGYNLVLATLDRWRHTLLGRGLIEQELVTIEESR